MNYSIHGPYRMHRRKGLVDTSKEAIRDFWKQVEDDEPYVSNSCGCYVFAIRAGKGVRPWYVGLAEKQSFEHECYSIHKINIYNEALAERKGTPILFLIARRTNGEKFSKPSSNGHRSAQLLETLLIGSALDKNPDLMNVKDTAFLRDMTVPTILNTPRRPPTEPEREFKLTME